MVFEAGFLTVLKPDFKALKRQKKIPTTTVMAQVGCEYLVFLFCFLFYFIRFSYHKTTNMLRKKKQIKIEWGNAAQKGRYEQETHARYRPDEEKNAKI